MTLARWTGLVQDGAGNAVAGAQIEVRNEETGRLVPLFADRDGVNSLGNPFTAPEATVGFHAEGGAYRITATKGGELCEWRYVALGTAAEYDLDGLVFALSAGVYPAGTLADLQDYEPDEEGAISGVVYADPDPANNGYYVWEEEEWVKKRGFRQTFAEFTNLGGTANAQTGTLEPWVDPSEPRIYIVQVATDNTGPMTFNSTEVVNLAGNPLSAGEWTGVVLFIRDGDRYRLIIDAGAAASAAQSATEAGEQKAYAEEWAQSPDPISEEAGGDGSTDRSAKWWAERFKERFKQEWSDSVTYLEGDTVQFEGSLWIANQENIDSEPVEGADWSLLLSGAVIPDSSIEFTKLNDTAYDWPKAFGAAEANDAATNDAAFGALEASPLAGRTIDLGGATFPVTAVPTGARYQNGGFLLAGMLGQNNDVDLIVPASRTFDWDFVKISEGDDDYESWPQDTLHIAEMGGNPLIICGYSTGAGHGVSSKARQAISYDFGKTFGIKTTVADPSTVDGDFCMSFSAGSFAGQELALVRVRDQSTGDHLYTMLMARRLFEMRWDQEIEITTNDLNTNIELSTPNGPVDFGVKVGDTVTVSNFGTVNGVSVSGTLTVGRVGATFIRLDGASGSPSAGTEVVTGNIVFNQTDWSELLFDGEHFSDAVLEHEDNPFSSNPILYHSMYTQPGSGGGDLFTGTHGGGGGGPFIIKANAILRDSRSIAAIHKIGSETQGGEPTLDRTEANSGVFYGALRGDNNPAAVWWCPSEDFTQATVTTFPLHFARDSPVPVALDVDREIVYFVLTDTRYRDEKPGPVPLLLAWAKFDAFQADGAAALRWWKLRDLWFSRTNGNVGANAVGVPSCAYRDGVLYIGYSTEHPPVNEDTDGQPAVYVLRLAVGANGPIGANLPKI